MTLEHLSVERLNQIIVGSLITGREIRIMARVCLFHHPDCFIEEPKTERKQNEIK